MFDLQAPACRTPSDVPRRNETEINGEKRRGDKGDLKRSSIVKMALTERHLGVPTKHRRKKTKTGRRWVGTR